MDSECSEISPQFQDIKKKLNDVYESLMSFTSFLEDQQGIDVLKELKRLSKKFTDTSKMVSAYHVNRLLVPYTKECGEIFRAVNQLSIKRRGALIVIQREDPIHDFITKGIPLHAEISSSLLDSLFHVGSPLHDGAVLIQKDVIVSAANILPLTRKMYKKKLGTRHRAAIGLTEETDALIFVVSEETGKKSFAFQGFIYGFETLGGNHYQ